MTKVESYRGVTITSHITDENHQISLHTIAQRVLNGLTGVAVIGREHCGNADCIAILVNTLAPVHAGKIMERLISLCDLRGEGTEFFATGCALSNKSLEWAMNDAVNTIKEQLDNAVEAKLSIEDEKEAISTMSIYLSGKISNLPEQYVKEQFLWGERYILSIFSEFGDVLNPLEINKVTIRKDDESDFDFYRRQMLNDLFYLWQCEAIAMLPNWEASPGARIEHAIAKELNKIIIYIPADFDKWTV